MPVEGFEVIVANDDADPIASDALDGLQGKVLQGPFGGLSAALNAAMQVARADYLTVSADDDLVLPRKLEALADALDQADAGTAAVFGWPVYTDFAGTVLPVGPDGCPKGVRGFLAAFPVVTLDVALRVGLYVHGTAPMYRRWALERVAQGAQVWDESLPTAEEFDLHHRLLRFAGVFRGVDVPVVTYRAGGKHMSWKRERGKRPREIMNRIYAKVA